MNIIKFKSHKKNIKCEFSFNKKLKWFIQTYKLTSKSFNLNRHKQNGFHPIRPKRGEIYLIDFGQNIGSEINDIHMGIIIQSSIKNNVSNTVIVVPISSSPKLCDTHELITNLDIQSGHLNKIPSKAKAEQLTCIDKARLIHKIGNLTPDFMHRLDTRILRNLDIKQDVA